MKKTSLRRNIGVKKEDKTSMKTMGKKYEDNGEINEEDSLKAKIKLKIRRNEDKEEINSLFMKKTRWMRLKMMKPKILQILMEILPTEEQI